MIFEKCRSLTINRIMTHAEYEYNKLNHSLRVVFRLIVIIILLLFYEHYLLSGGLTLRRSIPDFYGEHPMRTP